VNAARVGPGDVVIVTGTGGIGISAVQGAKHAGASRIIAVDPVELKRNLALQLGATNAFADHDHDQAIELGRSLTNRQGADAEIISVGVVNGGHVAAAVSAIRKAGTVVVTAAGSEAVQNVPLNLLEVTMYQKRIQGAIYAMMSPSKDVPRLLELWRAGHLQLEAMLTRTYSLDDINQGCADMHAGINMRGMLMFDQPSAASSGASAEQRTAMTS
jgi:S-(hydroxymethyl)glutathione dehydrogenase/alcohol dehydrogenase